MNLNFFQKYTEGRLNTTDGDGCQNLKMLLNDIKIDYVKTGSQRYKDYLYAKDFKLNKSIEIEDGFNFDGMNTIDYYKSNLKDAENVYEIKSETK